MNKYTQLLITSPEIFFIKLKRRLKLLTLKIKLVVSELYIFRGFLQKLKPTIDKSNLRFMSIDTNEYLQDKKDNLAHIQNETYKQVLQHRFKILSSEYFDCNRTRLKPDKNFNDAIREIHTKESNNYIRINWHKDFKSGYIWDPNILYINVPTLPSDGVDIKIPRELSRFQHIGQLMAGSNKTSSREFLLQVIDWIASNPANRGVNWACTMDVAIRSVNLIWGLSFYSDELDIYPKTKSLIYESLINHGHHIEKNLEYYEECTGNHYLSNIAGLIYIAYSFPDYEHSDRWLLFGIQELISEMKRQVYDDGGSHEASTHYHRLVAEIFLSCTCLIERLTKERRMKLKKVDLKKHKVEPRLLSAEENKINVAHGNIFSNHYYKKLFLMCNFTYNITKPNGLVPQIGDNDSSRLHKLSSDYNEYRDHTHILSVAGELFDNQDFRELGLIYKDEGKLIADNSILHVSKNLDFGKKSIQTAFFKDSGIAVLKKEKAWLMVTCCPNGQKGMGGHGHNDKNSFELNLAGYDFFVDGGCPVYLSHPDMRNFFRSTMNHNTLAIEDAEQDNWDNSYEGIFRLEEKSNPCLHFTSESIVTGSHSGYGNPHIRKFELKNNELLIFDTINDKRKKFINFNLDPMVEVSDIRQTQNQICFHLIHKAGVKVKLHVSNVDAYKIVDGAFGHGFGVPIKNKLLRFISTKSEIMSTICWD